MDPIFVQSPMFEVIKNETVSNATEELFKNIEIGSYSYLTQISMYVYDTLLLGIRLVDQDGLDVVNKIWYEYPDA